MLHIATFHTNQSNRKKLVLSLQACNGRLDMYKRKTIFHFTDIESLILIISGQRILCSSVKTKLPKNLDFLPGQHLAPIIMKNIIDSDTSVEKLRVIIDSVAGAVIPIIVTSYLLSTTTSLATRHFFKS